MNFVNTQLGRILLGLALVTVVLYAGANGPKLMPEKDQKALDRPILVELDKSALATASSEIYFVEGPRDKYAGSERGVFVQEKKVKVFTPVLLELPPASIDRASQVLPEPGPSLEGSVKLPRYGEEFPAIVSPKNEGK
jgi:hypothetical protein